jgi:hypothetical protein
MIVKKLFLAGTTGEQSDVLVHYICISKLKMAIRIPTTKDSRPRFPIFLNQMVSYTVQDTLNFINRNVTMVSHGDAMQTNLNFGFVFGKNLGRNWGVIQTGNFINSE